jgi:hypothetical protein
VSGKQPLTQRQQNKGDDRGLQETAKGAPPIYIEGTVVKKVESFKYLGIHIRQTEIVLPHRQWSPKKYGFSPKTFTNIYKCTVECILSGCITAWYGTALNCKALQRVVRSAKRITGGKLPALQDTVVIDDQ